MYRLKTGRVGDVGGVDRGMARGGSVESVGSRLGHDARTEE